MYLIVGGCGQGKLSWLRKREEIHGKIADGAVCSMQEAESCAVLDHFHLLVRRLLEEGKPSAEILSWTESLCDKNPYLIVINDEIGCGIVPLEKSERDWRETAGRACCILAERSERVDRIVCGIGIRLKEGGRPCFQSWPF